MNKAFNESDWGRAAICVIRSVVLATVVVAGAGCNTFDVNVAADEPIKVDLNMEVHVYQHGKADEDAAEARKSYKEVTTSVRNRMEEVQTLKDNRLVGENHEGLLSIREKPAGEYGQYVEKTVKAENEDREFLMNREATERGMSMAEIRENSWRHRNRKSFPGEWIEIEGRKPDTYRWVQKEGSPEEDGETQDGETSAASGSAE